MFKKYLSTIEDLTVNTSKYPSYSFGYVRRLDINDKYIYLWQNARGEVCYSFNLLDKEYHTTSAIKLGNILVSHFGCKIEVVNNEKEQLKKFIGATSGLNKALADNERYDNYTSYNQENQLYFQKNSTSNVTNNPHRTISSVVYNQNDLHQRVIQLSTYYLESHINTIYIKIDELFIVHQEIFMPDMQQAFFKDTNKLICKNSFVASSFMVYNQPFCRLDESFIIKFIFFMAKNNIAKALKILIWIADTFFLLGKIPFALVLYAKDDIYMKLFYEEIIEPLFNDFQCGKITNNSLDKKSLSTLLEQKIIYHFHNITDSTIFGEAAKELTNRLIHKNTYRLNNKSVTTMANVLITSTTNYIPMIADDVQCSIVDIASNIDDLCEEFNIQRNQYYQVAELIKRDILKFVNIIKFLDLDKLYKNQVIDYNFKDTYTDILDGDVKPIEVFNKLIKDNDIVPFELATKDKNSEKLVQELKDNFNKNRVCQNRLLDYFQILFGVNIYKSNRELIKYLKYYSSTNEPFDSKKVYVRDGKGYYFL